MKGPTLIGIVVLALTLTACTENLDPCARVSQIPRSECGALVEFYEATDGGNWKDRRGWVEGSRPCEWHGVECDGGHVSSISLNYNELRGTLPISLSELPHLRTLSLYFNHLGGDIPSEYGQLENLEVLILHNNELEGRIPDEFANLGSLKKLDLDSNNIGGEIPPGLGNLPEIGRTAAAWK